MTGIVPAASAYKRLKTSKMYKVLLVIVLRMCPGVASQTNVNVIDLTNVVTWKDMQKYYKHFASEKQRGECHNCGFPEMGTTINFQTFKDNNLVIPAEIPAQHLMSKLVVIDASYLAKHNPNYVLSLADARRYLAHLSDKRTAQSPTTILFKFGWKSHRFYRKGKKCYCEMPGIGLDLAAWIAVYLGQVVGVATDTASIESVETRETKSVAGVLAKSGVYVLENVDIKGLYHERGCLLLTTPLKLLDQDYVPTRLTAFCPPPDRYDTDIVMTQQARHAQKNP